MEGQHPGNGFFEGKLFFSSVDGLVGPTDTVRIKMVENMEVSVIRFICLLARVLWSA